MVAKVITEKDLNKIPRANIVDFILDGIAVLEKDISLNELSEDISLITKNPNAKININNLIFLLNFLVEECKYDPFTGKIIYEATSLLEVLKKFKENINSGYSDWLLGVNKKAPDKINNALESIITYIEEWKNIIKNKLAMPLGNIHLADTYHSGFPKTYKHIPNTLPNDYHSNFFFEVKVKELCPFITTILFHPYSEMQRGFQESRSFAELSKVNLNLDFGDYESIEVADNIRGLRAYSQFDEKSLPGSYLILRGGHHRTRAIFMQFLNGKLTGEEKFLVQLVSFKDFPENKYQTFIREEIKRRDNIRKRIIY